MSEKSGVNNASATAEVRTAEVPVVLLVLVILALIVGTFAVAMLWVMRNELDATTRSLEGNVAMLQQARNDLAVASERAEKAERSAALSREYAVSAFFQTQVEWAKRGVVIQSPLEHHDPIPEAAYDAHDNYLEASP